MKQRRALAPWEIKLIKRSRANSSQIGCAVLAILDLKISTGWCFGPAAVITPDGYLLTNVRDANGEVHAAHPLQADDGGEMQISEFVDKLRRLCDDAQVDDQERIAFFNKARTWIKHDNRPEDQRGY